MDAPVDIATLLEWSRWAQLAADSGDTEAAMNDATRLLTVVAAQSPEVCLWHVVNKAIDVAVNAGRYRFAFEAPARWSAEAQDTGRQRFPCDWAYARINLAEAHHCLGEDTASAASLDEAEPAAHGDPLGHNGLALMRAWLLAETGQAAVAQEMAARVSPDALGPRYRSEYHYTRSLIARELGQVDEAIAQAREGFACAQRAASRRNGFFALGAAALRGGQLQRAIAALEEFSRHPYQGQSGPGLVLLAEAYEKLGRSADARQSYQWAVERDPESAAAATARQRLGQAVRAPSHTARR